MVRPHQPAVAEIVAPGTRGSVLIGEGRIPQAEDVTRRMLKAQVVTKFVGDDPWVRNRKGFPTGLEC